MSNSNCRITPSFQSTHISRHKVRSHERAYFYNYCRWPLICVNFFALRISRPVFYFFFKQHSISYSISFVSSSLDWEFSLPTHFNTTRISSSFLSLQRDTSVIRLSSTMITSGCLIFKEFIILIIHSSLFYVVNNF